VGWGRFINTTEFSKSYTGASAPRNLQHHRSARVHAAGQLHDHRLPGHHLETCLPEAHDARGHSLSWTHIHDQYMIFIVVYQLVKGCNHLRVTATRKPTLKD